MKKQSLIYPLAAVCMYLTPNLPCYAGEVFRNSVPEKDSIVYTLQGSMQADESLVGKDYNAIHQYMRRLGWDYSEHPNSSFKDHHTGVHAEVVYDDVLKQYVFKFTNHAGEFLDGDRGSLKDRQRNEMKSQTSPAWQKLNGNWDKWQQLKWKFKIPK